MPQLTQPVRSAIEPSLPRDAYLSAEFFERERERIFHREWFYVGRAEALPNPGDYLVADVAGESIIVVRTRGGDLRAHYNVCRHRGSRLALADDPPAACAALRPTDSFRGVITCPYHAWTYELDGAVRHAPFLGESDSFFKEEFALHPAGLEQWGGFIFLNLSPAEARARGHTLAAQLGPIPERIARYPLADLRVARRLVYEVAANWKVIAENYNECYHCGPVHPELCRIVPAFKQHGSAGLDWDHGVPQAEGTFTFTFSGRSDRAPFPGLTPEEQVRHKGELIYPNMMVSLSADHAAAFMMLPRGPGATTVVCDFLFHPSEIARPSFDPSDAAEFWDLVNRQDWAICESVQRGMGSRVFQHGYYAPMENYSLDMRKYIAERMREKGQDDKMTG
jgi:Rieske 2Fe-2S family protein